MRGQRHRVWGLPSGGWQQPPGQSPPWMVLDADGWLPWQPCLRPELHLSSLGGGGKLLTGQGPHGDRAGGVASGASSAVGNLGQFEGRRN